MFWLTLVLSVGLLLSLFYSYSLFNLLKSVEHKRRRDWDFARQTERELLDRIMHMEGKTWTPPPVVIKEEQELDEETKMMLEGWREV